MHVFVTGATGFVGSAIVQELLQHGHQVTGLARSEENAGILKKAGASVYRGNLNDLPGLTAGVAQADAVIHTAFNHDFTQFKANCEADSRVIQALGTALAASRRPLVITSGIGLLNYGRVVTEADVPPGAEKVPRAASEEAAHTAAAQGTNSYIVRLPPTVHDKGDHGFIPIVIGLAKDKGVSAYIGEGANRWPAVHRLDAAELYRFIIEKQPAQQVFHAVGEEGIPFKDIANAIGQELSVPVERKDDAAADAHFGWFRYFASIDCPASSEQTRTSLGWKPVGPALLKDIHTAGYF